MEKHCTMVYFSLRESKQNKKGLSPIEVSITTNGKRIYFSTGKHVPAADWNKEKQAVKGKSEEAQLINGYLIQLRNKIYQKEIELLQKGYLITAELLKEAITDKVEALNEKTLLDVLNEHNTERKAMVGKTVALATYWVFEYTGRLFKEFIQQKYKRKDLFKRGKLRFHSRIPCLPFRREEDGTKLLHQAFKVLKEAAKFSCRQLLYILQSCKCL